jgi:asparagine synthase (glutamine-hydrolysing)
MSGFFGMLRLDGKPIEERFLEAIAEKMSFRGPHGRSVWKQDNLGGCFTLMRTGPAPQATQQPVNWRNLWLWGDLRLDGRRDLQKQLALPDHIPAENATSEDLLLRAWAKWGSSALERIIGDFSFALWDAEQKSLWCARDFVGPRPFYYAQAPGLFCFSNTLHLLSSVPDLSRDLDEFFLGDFLLEGWNADPVRTVYRDIKRLPAGHYLELSNSKLITQRFLKLPIEEPSNLKSPEDYLETYRDLLRVAVSDRLPERATALYLSGGLDSSSVCAIASQIAGTTRKKSLKAFTLSWKNLFDDPEPGFAKLTAHHLGIAHEILQEPHFRLFEDADLQDGRTPEPNEEVFFARERRLSRIIAAHSNVVLAGDGGDDILTGQAWPYLLHLSRQRKWKIIASEFGSFFWTHKTIPPLRGGFRTKLRQLSGPGDPFVGYPEWLNDDFVTRANLKQRWLELNNRSKNTEHPVHPNAYESLHDGYWAGVLETEDAGWNRVLLETRAPLLDLRVLTFLLRLPPVPWCIDKGLSRRAMRDYLPSDIVKRPKTPLKINPIERAWNSGDCLAGLPLNPSGPIELFVNWSKWCETLYHSKGSVNSVILRPASLFLWLNAVESELRIQ